MAIATAPTAGTITTHNRDKRKEQSESAAVPAGNAPAAGSIVPISADVHAGCGRRRCKLCDHWTDLSEMVLIRRSTSARYVSKFVCLRCVEIIREAARRGAEVVITRARPEI